MRTFLKKKQLSLDIRSRHVTLFAGTFHFWNSIFSCSRVNKKRLVQQECNRNVERKRYAIFAMFKIAAFLVIAFIATSPSRSDVPMSFVLNRFCETRK